MAPPSARAPLEAGVSGRPLGSIWDLDQELGTGMRASGLSLPPPLLSLSILWGPQRPQLGSGGGTWLLGRVQGRARRGQEGSCMNILCQFCAPTAPPTPLV